MIEKSQLFCIFFKRRYPNIVFFFLFTKKQLKLKEECRVQLAESEEAINTVELGERGGIYYGRIETEIMDI